MSKPIHTPGPIDVWYAQATTEGDIESPKQAAFFVQYKKKVDLSAENKTNARLLAAAYNAFDSAARKLNLNAVDLAERMQGALLADLVETTTDLRQALAVVLKAKGSPCYGIRLERADSILAKVNAGAS